MMRLIDADALVDDLLYDVELCARALDDTDIVGEERERFQEEKDCKQNCAYYLTKAPTIDAAPVVRCKDCVHKEREQPGMVFCPMMVGSWVDEDHFCGWGERREDDNDREQ